MLIMLIMLITFRTALRSRSMASWARELGRMFRLRPLGSSAASRWLWFQVEDERAFLPRRVAGDVGRLGFGGFLHGVGKCRL